MEINKKNLPVLYTIPRWRLETGSGNRKFYFVPWIERYVSKNFLSRELSKINKTVQNYYDRWILNITVPSQRPRCKARGCSNEVMFQKGIDLNYRRGYCHCESHRKEVVSLVKSEAGIKRYKNPEERLRQSEISKITGSNPITKMKRSESMKNRYRDPKERKRQSDISKKSLSRPEVRKKISDKAKLRGATPEGKAIKSNSMRKRFSNPLERIKASMKAIQAHLDGKFDNVHKGIGKKCMIYSPWENKDIYLDSTWELEFFNICTNKLASLLIRESVKIKYYDNLRKLHSYSPDFLLNDHYLIEIKPNYLLDDEVNIAKFNAADIYCRENGLEYVVLTEDYLFNNGEPFYGSMPF